MSKRMIWTNEIDSDELAAAREGVAESEGIGIEEVSDDKAYAYAAESMELWYEAEKSNLNRRTGRILLIADLGLWNGRRQGYKLCGHNLNEVLTNFQGDYCEVYCDAHNVCARDTHHDGSNYYTFREIKEGVDIEPLLDKLYNGTATTKDISRYTRSLRPYVAAVYGWTSKGKSKAA